MRIFVPLAQVPRLDFAYHGKSASHSLSCMAVRIVGRKLQVDCLYVGNGGVLRRSHQDCLPDSLKQASSRPPVSLEAKGGSHGVIPGGIAQTQRS